MLRTFLPPDFWHCCCSLAFRFFLRFFVYFRLSFFAQKGLSLLDDPFLMGTHQHVSSQPISHFSFASTAPLRSLALRPSTQIRTLPQSEKKWSKVVPWRGPLFSPVYSYGGMFHICSAGVGPLPFPRHPISLDWDSNRRTQSLRSDFSGANFAPQTRDRSASEAANAPGDTLNFSGYFFAGRARKYKRRGTQHKSPPKTRHFLAANNSGENTAHRA